MPNILTPKVRKAMERGLAECQACAELIGGLKRMNLEVEAKEAENEMIAKSIQEGLKLDDQWAERPDTGG